MASVKTVFRRMPQSRLKAYFVTRVPNFPKDFEWDQSSRNLVNALDKALGDVGDKREDEIRAELDSIGGVADRDGWRAVEEICRSRDIDLDGCEDEHDAIMMLALEHRDVFERALAASSFKRRNGGRDWSAFDIAGENPKAAIADEASRGRFVNAALEILNVPSVRKREADWYSAIRRDPLTGEESAVTQATVYVEERPESGLAFGDGESVERRIVPRVGEIGFSFDPKVGVFEVCATGGKAQREKYAKAFADCFFEGAAEPVEMTMREIDFDRFRRPISFVTEPAPPLSGKLSRALKPL